LKVVVLDVVLVVVLVVLNGRVHVYKPIDYSRNS